MYWDYQGVVSEIIAGVDLMIVSEFITFLVMIYTSVVVVPVIAKVNCPVCKHLADHQKDPQY